VIVASEDEPVYGKDDLAEISAVNNSLETPTEFCFWGGRRMPECKKDGFFLVLLKKSIYLQTVIN
jgi:hypothetical protein